MLRSDPKLCAARQAHYQLTLVLTPPLLGWLLLLCSPLEKLRKHMGTCSKESRQLTQTFSADFRADNVAVVQATPSPSPQAFRLLGRSALSQDSPPREPGGLGQMEAVAHEEWDTGLDDHED